MVIQHNISAMNSHRQMGVNNSHTSKNLEKLSSGFKINRAADDAAGLAISEKMRGQIKGLNMASQNAENGVSLIQTAEGGLNETHAILQRMRELAVQSSNGTYADDVDRENIAKEVEALKSEIDRIASSTHYNGINLLDGSLGGTSMKGDAAAADAKITALGLGSSANVLTMDTSNGYDVEFGGNQATLIVRSDGTTSSVVLQIGDQTFALATAGTVGTNGVVGSLGAGTDFFTVKDGQTIVVASLTTGFTGSTDSGTVKVRLEDDGVANFNDDRTVVSDKTSKLIFQIGANGTADQRVGLHVDNMSTGYLGDFEKGKFVADISVGTRDKANEAINVLDKAINQVSGTRADLGALQNRLEHTINNLGTTSENLQSAESSIRDVDMAKEMMEFTKNNILVQASQSMLAQANQLPQGVLQLLR